MTDAATPLPVTQPPRDRCLYAILLLALAVRRRKRKRINGMERRAVAAPTCAQGRWSMDFVSDSLSDGRRFRSLNIVDDYLRECLATEVDTSIPGARVVRVVERLREERGLPEVMVMDNGPEFAGQALDVWAYQRGYDCISLSRGSRCRMLSSRASTARCGMNA